MKFTQEIKDNWLENLKSGKYVQGFGDLYIRQDNTYCCIGVLGECTKGLSNDSLADENESPYGFLQENIGTDTTRELWTLNDNKDYVDSGRTDYSNVIPFIESLPVKEKL
jgi:hypothetical protein